MWQECRKGLGVCAQSRPALHTDLLTVARQPPLPRGFPRQEYWSGSLFLGNFLTQGLNLHLPHCQMDSSPLSPLGSPGRGVGGEKRESRQHRENSGEETLDLP